MAAPRATARAKSKPEYTRHRLSALFPDTSPEEFETLKESIAAIGQQHPITRIGGEILDGWHRYRACVELGIEPKFEDVDPDDPEEDLLNLVMAENMARRQLSSEQRIKIAQDALGYAGPVKGKPKPGQVTQQHVAQAAGVSLKTVQRFDKDRAKAQKPVQPAPEIDPVAKLQKEIDGLRQRLASKEAELKKVQTIAKTNPAPGKAGARPRSRR